MNPVVTDHAARRWLERAEGWDLSEIVRALPRGAPDGAIVAAWSRLTGRSFAGLCEAILTPGVAAAVAGGAASVAVGRVTLVIRGGSIVTVKDRVVRPKGKGPRWSGARRTERRSSGRWLEAAE
jgi:hypothetical protein